MSVTSIPTTSPPRAISRATTAALVTHAASTATRRVLAALVALGCCVVLGTAAWLTPSPTGEGTHTQMGLPNCGWISMMDMPCPTCGMTTAFAHAANGHFRQSFLAQPMGFLLVLATAMTLLVCVHTLITGSRLPRVFLRLWGVRSGWLLAGLIVAAWAFKIASHKGWIG